MNTRRKIGNCFDRLERLVGNRVPVHGSEMPFLVKVLEAIAEERKIAEELLEFEEVRIARVRELAKGWMNASWIADPDEGSPDSWRLLGGCGRDLLGELDDLPVVIDDD